METLGIDYIKYKKEYQELRTRLINYCIQRAIIKIIRKHDHNFQERPNLRIQVLEEGNQK
jgi:hypothetical protein